jgi:hypothetical protein
LAPPQPIQISTQVGSGFPELAVVPDNPYLIFFRERNSLCQRQGREKEIKQFTGTADSCASGMQ